MITDIDRAEHILESIERIDSFIGGASEAEFLKDEKMMYACYANLMIIGEAATKITRDRKKKIDTVEWQLITKFRNVIIHEYFRINWRLMWDVMKNNLPGLKEAMKIVIE